MDWRFHNEQRQDQFTKALDRYLTSEPEDEEYDPVEEHDRRQQEDEEFDAWQEWEE